VLINTVQNNDPSVLSANIVCFVYNRLAFRSSLNIHAGRKQISQSIRRSKPPREKYSRDFVLSCEVPTDTATGWSLIQ
jgi:hypothetical protein